VGDLARRQILAFTDSALRNAGVTGIIPTPLGAVAKAAGIAEVIDISRLPGDIAARKPPALKRILGALLHRERVALVDLSQCKPRARLTEAHEIGHQIIPWHEAAFQLDDEERLLGRTRDQLEREAYLAGGHLIFQGEHFWRRALDYQVSIGAPVALAPEYGASLHATIRYYVLHHPDPVAVLVAGRYQNSDGSVPVWESVDSPSFLAKFGMLAGRMAGHLMIAGGDGQPLGDIAMKAMSGEAVAAKDVVIPDITGERRLFNAEAFYNRHNLFVMVTEKKAARFGRRIHVAAS
jgi:hypothetical protein